jgi:hypothetical protein
MRASRILAIALLLTPGLAWAEEAAPTDAPPTSQGVALYDSLFEGGGCVLPDLAGLSQEDAETALEGAGFDVSAVETATQACPTSFSCSSITNCGITGLCSGTDIGPCCTVSSGLGVCCIQGTIKVRKCPCGCTGNPCNIVCPQSTDVKWRCS